MVRALLLRVHLLRVLYLVTLVVLQLALVVKLAPPLGAALRADALAGLAPEGWAAMLQVFATALAVVGASLALIFPGVALARHRRSGTLRFLGLPTWAVGLALAGIALLAAAALGLALAPVMPAESRTIAYLVARPAITGGLALATAGVLCAELLRRSVPVPGRAQRAASRPARIEVTYPPDLRTCALSSAHPIDGRLA